MSLIVIINKGEKDMQKQEQLPEILFKRIVSIEVEWIKNNIFSDIGINLFYTDNPYIQIFIGGNFFQVFHTNKWHTYFENIDYKNKKTYYESKK
jgi:hypothetical protein